MKVLIFGGKTGWIGKFCVDHCQRNAISYIVAESRLENREHILEELNTTRPTHVFNCAGLVGSPTIDSLELKREETVRVNVTGTLNLADCCHLVGIHLTVFATGCIFKYDNDHPIGGLGYKEEDVPNFHGSFYSHTKAIVEDLLGNFSNCLVLRIRMPIDDKLTSRNFITKILSYRRVIDVPNSMTVLSDLIPVAFEAANTNTTGILNFTNPGVISHNEILSLYKKMIDPSYIWQNFTLAEEEKVLKVGRSNNCLDTSKLKKLFPQIPDIRISMVEVFVRMRAQIEHQGKSSLQKDGWIFPPARDPVVFSQ